MKASKAEIRQEIILKCNSLSDKYKLNASKAILTNIIELLKENCNIVIYHACDYEISLKYIIDFALKHKISIYQPVSYKNSKIMRLDIFDKNNKIFFANSYVFNNEISWDKVDIIFIPLIAIDINGNRIGRGAGYYDSTLSFLKNKIEKPFLCGVGYSCQLINESIIKDPWDIELDAFLSEQKLLKF